MRPRLAQLHQSGATDGQRPAWDNTAGAWVPTDATQSLHASRSVNTAAAGNDTLTLDATPYEESLQVFVNGALLTHGTDYTFASDVVTFGSPLAGSDVVVDHYLTATASPGESALSTAAASSPALRGTPTLTFVNNASTVNATLPTGVAAGDLLVVMAGHGWSVTTPTGFTSDDSQDGGNVNGESASKAASSTDVTNGYVTVDFGGSYYGAVAVVAFQGGTSGIREAKFSRSGTGSSPVGVTTTASAATTDTAVYFGFSRSDSGTNTVDRGTQHAQRTGDTQSASVVATEEIASAGTVTANFSHSVVGSGYYDGIVLVKGAP